MMDKLCIFLLITVSLSSVTQGETVDYFCPAKPGQVDYTQHDLYNDGIDVQNTSAISFQVKCKENAYILLHEKPNDYSRLAVEIVLGSAENMAISISDKLSQRYTWCRVPHVLSQFSYNFFWISWKDKDIYVGKGDRQNRKNLVCHEQISCEVNYISIGTSNSNGSWKFNPGISAPSTVQPASISITSTVTDGDIGFDKTDNLTAVYIAVSATVVVAALIVAAIVVYWRYKKRHKLDGNPPDVVYSNSTNISTFVNTNLASGIENPTYEEHKHENQQNIKSKRGEDQMSNKSNYTSLTCLTEQATNSNTNEYSTISLQIENDTGKGHVYNHIIIDKEESTTNQTEYEDDKSGNTYAHVSRISVEENASDGVSGTGNSCGKPELAITDDNNESKITENDDCSIYDHANVGEEYAVVTDGNVHSYLNDA